MSPAKADTSKDVETRKDARDADKRAAAKRAGSSSAKKSSEKKSLPERLYTGDLAYNFIKGRKTWYIVSAIVVLLCIGAIALRGLNLGIEFRGGADFQVTVEAASEEVQSDLREALQDSEVPDLGGTTIQVLGENRIRVQTRSLDVDELSIIRGTIAETLGVSEDAIDYGFVGASWGGALTQRALVAVGIFLVLVAVVIGIYFRDWSMAGAAILALFHDIIVTVGVYAAVGFTVSPSTVIALLTILGYSLYDTVVVFDRVKENAAKVPRAQFPEAANQAVNQVIVRSINTTIVGVIPVAAVLFAGWFYLGIGPLKDLGLAMLVGMLAGAYSSLFIATPLLVDMSGGTGSKAAGKRRRAEARADAKAKAKATPKPTVVVTADEEDAEALPATSTGGSATAEDARKSSASKTTAEKDAAADRRAKAADARAKRRQQRADARDEAGDTSDAANAGESADEVKASSSDSTAKPAPGTRSQPRRRPRKRRS